MFEILAEKFNREVSKLLDNKERSVKDVEKAYILLKFIEEFYKSSRRDNEIMSIMLDDEDLFDDIYQTFIEMDEYYQHEDILDNYFDNYLSAYTAMMQDLGSIGENSDRWNYEDSYTN